MSIDPQLPGADLVQQGIDDATAGKITAAALLVTIGAPRLRALGITVPPVDAQGTSPELALYELLNQTSPADAHAQYNSMVQRLVSFQQALELEQGRALRAQRAKR